MHTFHKKLHRNIWQWLVIGSIVCVMVLCFTGCYDGSDDSDSSYTPSYSSGSSTSSYSSGYSSSADDGEYFCLGKNDTCPNKTHSPYDLYCSSCDPDGDNIEG